MEVTQQLRVIITRANVSVREESMAEHVTHAKMGLITSLMTIYMP